MVPVMLWLGTSRWCRRSRRCGGRRGRRGWFRLQGRRCRRHRRLGGLHVGWMGLRYVDWTRRAGATRQHEGGQGQRRANNAHAGPQGGEADGRLPGEGLGAEDQDSAQVPDEDDGQVGTGPASRYHADFPAPLIDADQACCAIENTYALLVRECRTRRRAGLTKACHERGTRGIPAAGEPAAGDGAITCTGSWLRRPPCRRSFSASVQDSS